MSRMQDAKLPHLTEAGCELRATSNPEDLSRPFTLYPAAHNMPEVPSCLHTQHIVAIDSGIQQLAPFNA